MAEQEPPGEVLTSKDFQTDQDIRWCPGCGDYSILKQVQTILPQIGLKREEIVFVAGIGCSSRFPYYMETYGMHTIHGRATAVALTRHFPTGTSGHTGRSRPAHRAHRNKSD